MTKKIMSVIMVLVVVFSCVIPVANAQDKERTLTDISNISDYKEYLRENGYPAITTEQYMKIAGIITTINRILTGQIINPKEHFNVTVDALITEISDYALERTGFDLEEVMHRLPNISKPADVITDTFNIDTTALREEIFAIRDELNANGDGSTAAIYHFLGVYMSVIELCEIYTIPVEGNPDMVEIVLRFTFKDGAQDVTHVGIYINTVTGECSNSDNTGMGGLGFNFNIAELTMYATVDCWMRNFGFCLFYDVIAGSMPWFFNYNTRRFKFDYDGKEWMIQAWKGNYVITNGAEVGIYNRDASKFGTFYNCVSDEEMLEMSMQVCAGEKILVDKPLQKHWWINGFNLSGRMYLPSLLTLKFSIVMPDEEMRDAFCESIDKHYRKDVSYTVDGLTVNVIW
ncbi:MAG: DUF4474 domain-containing protein [Clostridia bacterium]|nr:DUF4474 domain-containing protein [Clostridia bacterium]